MPTRRQTLTAATIVLASAGLGACVPGAGPGAAGRPAADVEGGDSGAATPPADPVADAPAAPSATPRPPGPAILAPGRALPGRLLFVSDSNVWLLERGQTLRLTPDRISRQPVWSRNGQRIALVKVYTSGSDLWLMDADGSNSEEVTDFSYRAERQQSYALHPAWLPDNSGLLFLSEQSSQDVQLWQLSLADRRRRRFLPPVGDGFGGVDDPVFSPDGATLAVTGYQAGQGPPGRPQIWLWSMPAGPWRQITSTPEGAYDPAWSPDGQRLAFAVRSSGRHDVWIARSDGSLARQVTTAGACRGPAWSPDGAWLAFLSAQGGTFDVWAVPVGAEPAAPGAAGAAGGAEGAPAAVGATGAARAITRGAVLDAVSGISWAP